MFYSCELQQTPDRHSSYAYRCDINIEVESVECVSIRFLSSAYNWAGFITLCGARADEGWLQVVPGKSISVCVFG